MQTLQEPEQMTGLAELPVGQQDLKLQHIVAISGRMRCWNPERLSMGHDFLLTRYMRPFLQPKQNSRDRNTFESRVDEEAICGVR